MTRNMDFARERLQRPRSLTANIFLTARYQHFILNLTLPTTVHFPKNIKSTHIHLFPHSRTTLNIDIPCVTPHYVPLSVWHLQYNKPLVFKPQDPNSVSLPLSSAHQASPPFPATSSSSLSPTSSEFVNPIFASLTCKAVSSLLSPGLPS